MKKYFEINVSKYSSEKSFGLWCVCTLENPKDHAVTFITQANIKKWKIFEKCQSCLIFWPETTDIPDSILEKNVVVKCANPHLRYCQFFEENGIIYLPGNTSVKNVNGAWISDNAKIGEDSIVFPGAYIGCNVTIGKKCYIGSGVKLVGDIQIGDYVVIRENTVIGADGLTTDKDENGKPVHMPQFGGVIIGDNVMIGANTVIARGAIDDTVIDNWASIDNCAFISHNVHVGKRTFIVGETIMFGSSSLGDDSFISGNSTIRNGVSIGEKALIGMGSVVTRNVEDGRVVKGNPAK